MGTIGPLARGPADLGLVLDALAGPDSPQSTAWRLTLPAPRADTLHGYRIAAWLDDPACPVDAAVGDRLAAAVAGLRAAGAKVDEVSAPVDLRGSYRLFQRLCQPWMSLALTDAQFAEMCAVAAADGVGSHATWARDVTARGRDIAMAREERQDLIGRWAEFFRAYDALLCPVTPTPALPHAGGATPRRLRVNGTERDWWDQVIWVQAVSAAHLPVAVVPVGRAGGLPVGVQVVGPYLEDRTVVDLAARFDEVLEGYVPPPGYSTA
jgi:amidase